MKITAADVADLREGDVVEVVETCCGDKITTRGPVRREGDYLNLGDFTLVRKDGEPAGWYHSLTVVSRAPRPLYVNSDRTEPVPGDYARDADADGIRLILRTRGQAFPDKWIDQDGIERSYDHIPGRRLRLLVDGETGQAVP